MMPPSLSLPAPAPLRWAIGLLIATALGIVIVFHAPYFELRHITVRGNRVIPEDMLQAAADVRLGRPLIARLGPIAERLRQVPGVRDASVTRRWPGSVDLRITEAVPVARTRGEDGALGVIDSLAQPLPLGFLDVADGLPLVPVDSATIHVWLTLRRLVPPFAADIEQLTRVGDTVTAHLRHGVIYLPVTGIDSLLASRLIDAAVALRRQRLEWAYLDLRTGTGVHAGLTAAGWKQRLKNLAVPGGIPLEETPPSPAPPAPGVTP